MTSSCPDGENIDTLFCQIKITGYLKRNGKINKKIKQNVFESSIPDVTTVWRKHGHSLEDMQSCSRLGLRVGSRLIRS